MYVPAVVARIPSYMFFIVVRISCFCSFWDVCCLDFVFEFKPEQSLWQPISYFVSNLLFTTFFSFTLFLNIDKHFPTFISPNHATFASPTEGDGDAC